MRAPSQLRKESADAYIVGNPHGLKIAGVSYLRGEAVPGNVARSWATFRSLLSIAWLIPAKDVTTSVAPVLVSPTPPTPRRTRNK